MHDQRYQILHLIEKGGMAEVFHALAESIPLGFKRHVAIKRILPSLSQDPKFVSMFLDEARLSLHLHHANIVQVTDIGQPEVPNEWGERPYFLVMEYVEGINLKKLLEYQKKQTLPVSYSLYIMMEVCKALAYAHELTDPDTGNPLKVIHRDISPPNILISNKGEIKLTDFGLAKAASQVEKTEPGMVKGKFSYLSPETALGAPIDHRSDLFCVGIVLYELLTGEKLFDGDTDYAVLEKVQKCQIPSLSEKNPQIDAEVASIVKKLLTFDPNQRYQSASEVCDDIAHYLFQHGQKITSRDFEKLLQGYALQTKQSAVSSLQKWADGLIQEELLQFASLDQLETPNLSPPPTQDSSELLVDPRSWDLSSFASSSVFVAFPKKPQNVSNIPIQNTNTPQNISPNIVQNQSALLSLPESSIEQMVSSQQSASQNTEGKPSLLMEQAPAILQKNTPAVLPENLSPIPQKSQKSSSRFSGFLSLFLILTFIVTLSTVLLFSKSIALFFCHTLGVFCG